jgi:hypothetical protein
VVAWAPVVRGRRYVRELQLLGLSVPADRSSAAWDGAIVQAGSIFTAGTLEGLGALDLSVLPAVPAARTLVIDRDDRLGSTPLLDRLVELGARPDHLVLAGTDQVLDQPTEYATVAEDIVDHICSWVGPGEVHPRLPEPRARARFPWEEGSVIEEVVRLGPHDLVAVVTRPVGPSRATVLWLNSGSEHHIGPGRAWVEYARQLALVGYTSVRADFSGWGESPDCGHAPGRPYDPHGTDEAGQMVGALRDAGHRHVVVAGLCAGAWIALRVALTVAVDGVVAINPQLYWQPGDPVEADIVAETRVRRHDEIRRIKTLRDTGLWWALDAVGVRHPVAVWLRSLARAGVPVMTLFADGDDGLEFLVDRTGRAWAEATGGGGVDLVVVDEIDHPMHRHWLRSEVVSALCSWLESAIPSE